jgi:hypothetical protein
MRTKVWVAAVLLVACFLLVAGAAQAKAPLKCTADFYSDATMDHWEVALTGDIDGTMYVHGDESVEWFFPGKTEHFFETWITYPDSGGWFSGTDGGVWSFVTFKFRANGWVTDASPEWRRLVGYKFHEVGTTTNPFIADFVAGEGDLFFAGP